MITDFRDFRETGVGRHALTGQFIAWFYPGASLGVTIAVDPWFGSIQWIIHSGIDSHRDLRGGSESWH